MAASNHILSLSLGNQTVAVAEFKTDTGGGLVLSSYQTRELLADPAADATRLAQTKLALGEMAQVTKQKGAAVHYAISAQSVFTRFVKLPSVGEEQVDQIVSFEAQQNVPYPIDEVVWDYALVDSGQAKEVEVVIVAIKSDLLDGINESVEEAQFKTAIVDVAPMAIYNAFRYNYSDVDGCSLVIDIGARSTNLIFIEPHKVFSRSIPNAGSTITQAIAKDFNEPFGAAEERKKRDGFVSLGGSYAEPEDPDVARVSKMIRNSMTRLHAEIARSISFYRSQQGGSAPQRVFLSGGSAGLPYLREFFHEKFQLPVEFFNPLRNVAVGNDLNIEEIGRSAHRMGELVGLALRGSSNCPMELNLRPRSVVQRQELARRRPFILLAGVCTLLALAAWWLYLDRVAVITAEVAGKIAPKVTALKDLDTKMKVAKDEIAAQQATVAPLVRAVEERGYWLKIIEDINLRLPKELVWITSFEAKVQAPLDEGAEPAPGPKGQAAPKLETVLLLKGLYLTNKRANQASVADEFKDKLLESPHYTLDQQPPRYKRSVPNDAELAFDFEFPLILKNPIKLPDRK